MSNIPVHQILREVRHLAWTPVNPDGTTPELAGAAVAPAANDWQPIGYGRDLVKVGSAAADTVTWRGDLGQMLTLSGYSTMDTIVDHTGDGDDAVQRRSVEFEDPQSRTLSFIAPAGFQWLARFLTLCFRDGPPKRPFELRETHYDVASAVAAVNLAAGYIAGYAGAILIDGTNADDLSVGDLINFDGTSTVYGIVARGAASITLDKPLAAAIADNDDIARAARTVRTQQKFWVETAPQVIESKSVLKIDGVTLQPYDRATEEGMQ